MCVGDPLTPSSLVSKHMEARFWCLVLALQMVISLASATSRPFSPTDGVGLNHPVAGRNPESAQVSMGSKSSPQDVNSVPEGQAGSIDGAEAYSKEMSRIGSSPPSCEHKCHGCTPCEAIQVPTTGKRHNTHFHLGVNYANYEPEGWKCKCGPSFYAP